MLFRGFHPNNKLTFFALWAIVIDLPKQTGHDDDGGVGVDVGQESVVGKKSGKLKKPLIDTVKPAKITIHQKAFIDEPRSQKLCNDDRH